MNFPRAAAIKENTYIASGILVMAFWVILFIAGLLIDSSYYRVALNFGFWEWRDWFWAIMSFTVSNVAILAFLAGLLGGICSKVIATEGFTLTKAELTAKKVSYILYENPFISAFRGVFMFLAILSVQYLSSFSDLGSINNIAPQTQSKEELRDKQAYIALLNEVKDSTSRVKIQQVWDEQEKKAKEMDVDSLVHNVVLLKDSLAGLPKTENLTIADLQKKNEWTERMRSLRKAIKVPPLVDIPGISSSSYFKFAVLVSLLAFVCGYDPNRFNSILSRIPVFGEKKEVEK